MEKIAHYCQKCSAANEPGEANCYRCGTRLMLVVFPPSVRHEDSITPSYYEDHLLERVSLLELRLSQVMEQLGMAYEFIRREAKSFHNDHVLLQSFFESLEKVNPEFSQILTRECLNIYNEKFVPVEDKSEDELKKILLNHDDKNAGLFTHLVNEGIKLLEQNEEKQAFLTLEKGATLSPQNVALFSYLAKELFRADKFDAAKTYLEKAFEIEPQNENVLLLLGTIYADEREAEKARKLLSVLANNPNTKVCVNFIWGILAAFEGNFTESLAAFKESLNKQETPELHYLIGCVYWQLDRKKLAESHFVKAVSENLGFADAWFMKSLIYKSLNKKDKEKQARQAAFEAKEAGAQCLKFMNDKKNEEPEIALPFQHFNKLNKRLLTGGSLRLNKFLREQIFKAID